MFETDLIYRKLPSLVPGFQWVAHNGQSKEQETGDSNTVNHGLKEAALYKAGAGRPELRPCEGVAVLN